MGCTVCTIKSAPRALQKCIVCTAAGVHGVHQKELRLRGGLAEGNGGFVGGGVSSSSSILPQNPDAHKAPQDLFRFAG